MRQSEALPISPTPAVSEKNGDEQKKHAPRLIPEVQFPPPNIDVQTLLQTNVLRLREKTADGRKVESRLNEATANSALEQLLGMTTSTSTSTSNPSVSSTKKHLKELKRAISLLPAAALPGLEGSAELELAENNVQTVPLRN